MTTESFTRRRFLGAGSMMACGIAFAPRRMFAQAAVPPIIAQARAAAATTKVTVQLLRRNVSAMIGAGGNMAVLPGKDGAVIVDSSYSTAKPNVMEALDGLKAGAPKHLINTHWHFDHTDGNEWMHAAGATILAHDNTRKHLSTDNPFALFNIVIPAAPAGAIPSLTFADKKTLHLNDATLNLDHYDPAHTDSDISVYFVEANVLHAGDTWFNGNYPFIDYSTGGNLSGMIRATERNLALATAETIIIPGHGPIGNKSDMMQFHEMLIFARDTVGDLKKQGKTLEEVTAAKPLASYDTKWGKGGITPDLFLAVVYQGV